MHLEPTHRKSGFLRIRKVEMVWIDNADEVRILSHAQVVLDIFEDNLNDRITIRDVCSREAAAVYRLQQRHVYVCAIVLLLCQSRSALRFERYGEIRGSMNGCNGRTGFAYHGIRHDIILGQQSLEVSGMSFADVVMIFLLSHSHLLVAKDGDRVKSVTIRSCHVASNVPRDTEDREDVMSEGGCV